LGQFDHLYVSGTLRDRLLRAWVCEQDAIFDKDLSDHEATTLGSPMKASWLIAAMLSSDMYLRQTTHSSLCSRMRVPVRWTGLYDINTVERCG
jgi:hypothetical protein